MKTQSEPASVSCRRFFTSEVKQGLEILDVGCGDGSLMEDLAFRGAIVKGIEIDDQLVDAAIAKGLDVRKGTAEQLPFPDSIFDAVFCNVVLPYTDQDKTITEWARVVKPGGFICATYHGFGYPFFMLRPGRTMTYRLYAARIMANTLLHRSTGWKLPGVYSDTLCQYSSGLNRSYNKVGLVVDKAFDVRRVLGLPVFICHRLLRV